MLNRQHSRLALALLLGMSLHSLPAQAGGSRDKPSDRLQATVPTKPIREIAFLEEARGDGREFERRLEILSDGGLNLSPGGAVDLTFDRNDGQKTPVPNRRGGQLLLLTNDNDNGSDELRLKTTDSPRRREAKTVVPDTREWRQFILDEKNSSWSQQPRPESFSDGSRRHARAPDRDDDHPGYGRGHDDDHEEYEGHDCLPPNGPPSGNPMPVPETDAYLLMLAGLAVVGFAARRRHAPPAPE